MDGRTVRVPCRAYNLLPCGDTRRHACRVNRVQVQACIGFIRAGSAAGRQMQARRMQHHAFARGYRLSGRTQLFTKVHGALYLGEADCRVRPMTACIVQFCIRR